jgi:hypothetical protein
MARFRLLGNKRDEPSKKRRASRPRERDPLEESRLERERGLAEIEELKEALRRHASEAARSTNDRKRVREVEELKQTLRERAAELAKRERELEEWRLELEEQDRAGRKRGPMRSRSSEGREASKRERELEERERKLDELEKSLVERERKLARRERPARPAPKDESKARARLRRRGRSE